MEDPSKNRPDRRRYERKALRCAAHLLVPGRQPLAVRALDICPDGMGVVAPVNIPTSARCVVRFAIPLMPRAGTCVEVQVSVIHSVYSASEDGFRIGLRFTSLAPEIALAISQFMKA